MKKALSVSNRILVRVGRVEIFVAGTILSGIVLMILVQVALGLGLGDPIAWEQEGGAYALVWLTFIGASIGLKQMRHVNIVTFVSSLPTKWKAAFRIATFAVIIWLLLVLMWELTAIIPIEGRAMTIALPIDLPRSWFFSVPLFGSCLLMLWTSVHYLLEQIAILLGIGAIEERPILSIEEHTVGSAE